jgi:hypothetical protein
MIESIIQVTTLATVTSQPQATAKRLRLDCPSNERAE